MESTNVGTRVSYFLLVTFILFFFRYLMLTLFIGSRDKLKQQEPWLKQKVHVYILWFMYVLKNT